MMKVIRAHTLDVVRRRKHEACHMTASKDGRQVALPDPDPSIALHKRRERKFEREFLAHHPTVEVIERAKKERAEFIAALLRRFAVRLKSLFRASAHSTRRDAAKSFEGVRRQA
jgi:hypothetical protein